MDHQYSCIVYCACRPDIIEAERDGNRDPPVQCAEVEASAGDLKRAPIPCALEALRQTADTSLWTLCCDGCLNGLCTCAAIARALAVTAAQAKVLPLAEGAVAAITCTMPLAFRVEAGKLIETDLLRGVLCAEDAAALSAVMAAVEEAKWHLA